MCNKLAKLFINYCFKFVNQNHLYITSAKRVGGCGQILTGLGGWVSINADVNHNWCVFD